eukprot:3229037-Rhodomonas_salina.1
MRGLSEKVLRLQEAVAHQAVEAGQARALLEQQLRLQREENQLMHEKLQAALAQISSALAGGHAAAVAVGGGGFGGGAVGQGVLAQGAGAA